MARLLTIPFSYREQSYTVIVSLTKNENITTVKIYLPDPSLRQLFPNGMISFDLVKGAPLDVPEFTETQELLSCIFTAIEQHDPSIVMVHNKNNF